MLFESESRTRFAGTAAHLLLLTNNARMAWLKQRSHPVARGPDATTPATTKAGASIAMCPRI